MQAETPTGNAGFVGSGLGGRFDIGRQTIELSLVGHVELERIGRVQQIL